MSKASASLCVVVHDVAPATWDACRHLLEEIARFGPLPVTLLAVPRYHGERRDPAFETWLKQRAAGGDEVVLHGLTHQDRGAPRGWMDALIRRHYTASEGEFSGLTRSQAARRISAGVRWMQRLALPLDGFVAPAWLMSEGTWTALRGSPFSYTCTLRRIHALPDGRVLGSQSQVFSSRSAWRRGMSIVWNLGLAAWQVRQECVRLELHPIDVEHPTIGLCWRWLLKRQLRTREATTLRDVAARLRPLEQQQHQLGGRETDRRTDGHVARVVQAEHDA